MSMQSSSFIMLVGEDGTRALLDWRSTKQTATALSTGEAELCAAKDTGKAVISIGMLLETALAARRCASAASARTRRSSASDSAPVKRKVRPSRG